MGFHDAPTGVLRLYALPEPLISHGSAITAQIQYTDVYTLAQLPGIYGPFLLSVNLRRVQIQLIKVIAGECIVNLRTKNLIVNDVFFLLAYGLRKI